MRKLVFLALFLSSFAFSQTTINEVIYKKRKTLIKKQQKKTKNNPMIKGAIDALPNAISKKSYKLLFKDTESIFFEVELLVENESKEIGDRFAEIMAKFMGGTKGVFYSNITKDIILQQTSFRTDLLLIKSKVSDKKWKIDFEKTKKIGSYICYKATTSKRILMSSGKIVNQPITAWFATELPYPFGPTEFVGLPGLILELEYYDKTVIYADKINLNKKVDKKEKVIKPLTKGIKVSNQEYIDFMKSSKREYKRPKR